MASLSSDMITRGGPQVPPRRDARAEDAAGSAAEASGSWTCAKLWLRVHADAFRFDPPGFLQALLWRARGLRVRARNRMAALAGRSPYAYAYWIACKEPQVRAAAAAARRVPEAPEIVPVIDCRGGQDGLEQTLQSLPAESRPVVIGAVAVDRGTAVANVAGIRSVLEGTQVWLCPIVGGDRLAPGALAAYSQAAAQAGEAAVIYADDDLIERGRRCAPHFKPDWNPDLFEHHDFVTGSCIVAARRADLKELPDGGWQDALVHRALERSAPPVHLPLVLHHRRRRPEPVIPSRPPGLAVEQAPLVTIVVPTRNRAELLAKCVEGVEQASYPNTELIIVDNESDEPESLALLEELRRRGATVMQVPGPFNFSVLNNLAVARARGDLLCFLNNDVEMIDPDWLALLVRQACRPDLGAVGARLLYPDGTVQHAGVFTGIGGGAAHAHRLQREDEPGYFERARLPQRVSAVTGACLVVAKEKFLAVGGFDEERFPVAFNDVDLCLKLNERGWQSFYEPRATLIHHESKSRGSDRAKVNRARFADELAALKRKWGTDRKCDPFHHPQLSPFCEQFLIAV